MSRAHMEKLTNVDFRKMDAEDLQLPNGALDGVTCSLGLRYCPVPNRALREMHRVLRSGSKVVLSVWGLEQRVALLRIIQGLIHFAMRSGVPTPFSFGFADSLRRALEQAGFSGVMIESMTLSLFSPILMNSGTLFVTALLWRACRPRGREDDSRGIVKECGLQNLTVSQRPAY